MPSISSSAEWLLPYRVYLRLQKRKARLAIERSPDLKLANANASLKNSHTEERCFVLCNGPSINRQDLSLLEGEIVLSVSSGYQHPKFLEFRPRYHCVPQITYGLMTENDTLRWFREMDGRLGNAKVFLSSTEEPLVRKHRLFSGREIHYVFFHDRFDDLSDHAIPDISKALPRVQSVPIMCLMLAMYMGFKRIYLLGTEHDTHQTGVYNYFFGANILSGKDPSVDASGRVVESQYDLLNGLASLWRQYRVIGKIAAANGVSILNATNGGALDEFPRVRFEDLFSPSALSDERHRRSANK